MSNTMAAILYLHVRTKLSTGGKFACGIRELYATPFIFVIPLGELTIKNGDVIQIFFNHPSKKL
jgi:hypothetical protein